MGFCGAFNGTNQYLSIGNHSDFNFGSGDFTIDCRVNFDSTGGAQLIMGRNGASDRSWSWYYNSGNLRFAGYWAGTTQDVPFAWTPTPGVWYHLAVVRNGTDIDTYVDGTAIGSTYVIGALAIRDSSSVFYIGENVENLGYHFNGRMDEIRISKGVVRWPSNFIPDTEPYTSDVNTSLLLHCENNFIDSGNTIHTVTPVNSPTFGMGVFTQDVLTGGTASATENSVGNPPANAVDNDPATLWGTVPSTFPLSWAYDLGVAVTKSVKVLSIKPFRNAGGTYIKDWELFGSNLASPDVDTDGDWTSITTGQHSDTTEWETDEFANPNVYRHYRVKITTNWRGFQDAAIYEFEMGETTTLVFEDIETDIRARVEELQDIAIDIRAKYNENIEDVDIDIRAVKQEFIDLATDIRAKLEEHFEDLDIDIRVKKTFFEDIDLDIRAVESTIKDIDTDIRVVESVIKDISTEIRVAIREIADINTDIRTTHGPTLNRTIVEEAPNLEEGYYLISTSVNINMNKVYNAVKMQFKNEFGGSWSALELFDTTKAWTINSGDGDKRIYIRFMDVNGNLSDGADFIDAVLTTTTVPTLSIEAYTDESAATPIVPSTYQTDGTPFFRWLIPDYSIPYSYFSYAMDETPDDLINLIIPTMVQTGMEISKVTPLPEMTLEAADGYYYYANDRKEFNSRQATLDAGGAQDRIDVVYISGTLESLLIVKGTESASPVAPEVTDEDSVLLAEVYVPAGATTIASVTLTDIRITYIDLNQYVFEQLSSGQHTLTVRAYTSVGTYSTSTFDIWVSNDTLIIGEVKAYTDGTKVTELTSGLYQTTDNTPYFEWTATTPEPGPIRYYYTEDGSEPDSGDSFLTVNNYTPGTYPNGITELKIRPYDVTTGYWGESKSFIFIYGTETFTDDTAVILGSSIFKQSLKEVHVKEISWDFDSARICRFFQPVAFDATLSFSVGDIVSVVYGSTNATVFRGRIMRIERTIDIGHEGVMYYCSGPRQELNEEYAYIIDDDFGETSNITFDNESLSTSINTIINKFPKVVKSVESYPTGASITDEYVGQVASNILDSIYLKTKYGWYIKPDGSLVSVDLTAANPEQAKFGIYGTTVNPISPQYNVMSSNLQFDITSRYNRCIVEGAKKLERVTLRAHCASTALLNELLGSDVNTSWDGRYKLYQMDSKWTVSKIIKTYVSYSRLLGYQVHPLGAGGRLGYGDSISGFYLVFLKTEIAKDNRLLTRDRDLQYGNFRKTPDDPDDFRWVGFTNWSNAVTELPQGTLGPDNTIRFSKSMWHMWPIGARENNITGIILPVSIGINSTYNALSYSYRTGLTPKCASVRADVLIETSPLKVEVNVPGTASGVSKTLRLVDTSFKYSEDPDNLIDDTARMTTYATDKLQKYKDIKINGSITLDTIDLDWDLDNTVNLINTDQASWSSINAKVIGIRYDFDTNTTILEITSEYLK